MPAGIGASGSVGVAREVTAGTYVAPEKFIPIRSESLSYAQETIFTRSIRQVADPVFAVPGNATIEGDIEFEVTHDTLPYLLYGMRGSVGKVGVADPFTYTLTPDASGQKSGTKTTLSFTIVRNAIVFGYTNCVIGSLELTVDNGIMVATVGVLGQDEASQADPTEAWPTSVPYGAGEYDIEIPSASAVTDVDTLTFTVNDNPEHAYRLRSTGRGAQFTKFGERSVELSVERDFIDRTDYDAFKALTAQAITFKASKTTNRDVTVILRSAIKDTYEIGLDGQGDLVRASITYQGIWNQASSESYNIVVVTDEDIT